MLPKRLRHLLPTFLVVLCAQAISILGSTISAFALTLNTIDQGGSPVLYGYILAATVSGSIYGAPFLGSFVDKQGASRVAVWAAAGSAVLSAALAFLARFPVGEVWPGLVTVVTLSGVCSTLASIAMMKSLRELRSEANLTRISAVVAAVEQAPLVLGPALGAALWHLASASVLFSVDAVLSVLAACAIRLSGWTSFAKRGMSWSWQSWWKQTIQGFQAIWADRGMRNLQLGMSDSNALTGFSVASISYGIYQQAERLGGDGEFALSATRVATGVGAVVGSLVVAFVGSRFRRHLGVVLFLAIAALVGRVGFGLSSFLAVQIGCLLIRNFAVAITGPQQLAAWQEKTEPSTQGAIFGARRLLSQGWYPPCVLAGGALGGVLTVQLGPGFGHMALVVACGVLELVVAAVLWRNSAVRSFLREPEKRQASFKRTPEH